MAYVVLNATIDSNAYARGQYIIREQQYNHCYIFKRYQHTPTRPLGVVDIYVYEKYKYPFGSYVTIRPSISSGPYKKASLEKAHVYYNKHESKTPLLLVLYFKGAGPDAKNRYYRRSSFGSDINQKKYRTLDYLTAFTDGQDERQLLQPLLEESEKYINIYAYQIEKKTPSVYNNITVFSKENVTGRDLSATHGFHFYRHARNEGLKNKKAYVLYNQQVLHYWNTKPRRPYAAQIDQIQNIKILCIRIFYGSKFNEPLMIQLTEDKVNGNHLYYFHKISNKTLYWQSLDATAFNNLLGQKIGSNEIHIKLTAEQNQLLIHALKKIEHDLTKILIIMVDMTNRYLENNVNDVLKHTDFDTNGCILANANGNVTVREVSSQCNLLSSKGYTLYEHDFSSILTSLQDNEPLILKLIRSKTEKPVQHKTMVTIDLDFQHQGGGYTSQSFYISVSNVHSIKHNFKWYRHNCEKNITHKKFILHFNGQYVAVEGDSSDTQLNFGVILVYFDYFYRDSFIIIAFPNPSFSKIKILTYSMFKSSAISGKNIKISDLERITANVESLYIYTESGYKMDPTLLDRLNKEYQQLKVNTEGSINTLDYAQRDSKLYVFSSTSNSQILMICYNNKAYARYYLGRNKSSWKQINQITRCICNSNSDRQDISDRRLLESLAEIETLVKIKVFNEPEEKPDQKEQQNEAKKTRILDISRTDNSEELSWLSVSEKHSYDQSNLFVYFTHTPKAETELTIESLIISAPPTKTITLKEALSNVKSVTVYFNKFFQTKPLVLCIRTGKGQESYYKDLIREERSYQIIKYGQISDNLYDMLIKENDKIINSVTYQIDETNFNGENTIKYGNEGSITVKKEDNPLGFTIYTHKPTDSKPRISYVLQNKNLLVGRSAKKTNDIEHSHGRLYNSVKIYSLTKEMNSMLLIEFHESSIIYYAFKKDGSGSYWGMEKWNSKGDLSIKNKLDEINYFLKSSVIIEIDKGAGAQARNHTDYPMKLIENKLNEHGKYISRYNDGKTIETKTIRATLPSNIPETTGRFSQSGYNYVKHEIPDSTSLSSLGSTSSNIVGIRLFLGKSTPTQFEEVFLYSQDEDASLSRNRLNLYYLSSTSTSTSKIFVFFHGEDSRPLVICFNDKIYKRRDNKATEWVHVNDLKCYQTAQILPTLKIVYKGMKKKITFVKDGEDKNIRPSHGQLTGSYRKTTYSPDYSRTQEGPFVLSMSTLTKSMSNITMVAELLDALNKSTFDTITKYYKDITKPLLFEFVDESDSTHIVRKDDIKYWSKEKVNDVQEVLPNIESSVDKTTVYEIDQMSMEYSTKIKLNPDRNKPTKDFTKYTHTPIGQSSTKSIILYKLRKLHMNNEPLKEIEDQAYKSVAAYFGNKAKDGNKAVPLIIELTSTDNNKKHYKHRLEKSSSNWETLNIPSSDTNDRGLIDKLKETELDMVQSVVVLLEKSANEDYGDGEIQNAVTHHNPTKGFNLVGIDSRTIRVRYKTTSEVKSIRDSGYNCCEHDLSPCFKGDKNYGIRFFILTGDSTDKYKEIRLCNSDESIDTLYYDNDAGTGKDKVYVYFYAKDPRPLLACYNGKAYRPKSKEDYESKWVREKKITKCLCDSTYDCSDLLSTLNDVAKILNVVFLDNRPLVSKPENELPDSPGSIDHKYCVQKFKNKDIYLKVTYRNKKCYRVYNYEPYGSDGQGGGYRLGNINYESAGQEGIGLKYESLDPLLTVSTYYSVYDGDHKNLLLVALEFKRTNSPKEYYKLKQQGKKEWVKMKGDGSDKNMLDKLYKEETLEYGLYDLRKDLKIEYKEKEAIRKLFKADECKEDSVDWVAVGAGSGGGIVGVGAIVTIGVVVSKKLAVTAVTTVTAAAAAAAA